MARKKRKKGSIYIFIFAPLIAAYIFYTLINFFYKKYAVEKQMPGVKGIIDSVEIDNKR